METKGVLFIKFDVSLYSEAECCTTAIKVGNLTGKASIPVLSTWSLGKESFLEKAAQCTTFCFTCRNAFTCRTRRL